MALDDAETSATSDVAEVLATIVIKQVLGDCRSKVEIWVPSHIDDQKWASWDRHSGILQALRKRRARELLINHGLREFAVSIRLIRL